MLNWTPGREKRSTSKGTTADSGFERLFRMKKTTPARGVNWGRHSSDDSGERHPVVHHQVIPRRLVPEADSETRQAALRWRLKLSHQPTVGSARFHWIDQLDDGLMDVIALGTLECSDVKVRGAGVIRASVVIVRHFGHDGL